MKINKFFSSFIAGGVLFTTLHAIEFDTVKTTGFPSGEYADLDNDGDMDLIAEKSNTEIIIVEQLADNIFSEKGALTLTSESDGSSYLADISVGDLNNDGKLDILTAGARNSGGPNMIFMNENNTGLTFHSTTDNLSSTNNLDLYAYKSTTGDFNGDSNLDAIWSLADGMQILFGKGDGTFSSNQFEEISSPRTGQRPIVSDIDGDGDLDIITISAISWQKSYQGAVYVSLNDGAGTFSKLNIESVPEYDNVNPMAIEVGDFNNDGKEDFIFSNNAQLNEVDRRGLVVALRTSENGEAPTYSYLDISTGSTNYANFIDVADVNNDGWDDIVFSLAEKGMKIFLNNKDNTFTTAYTFDGNFHKSELKDMNGDGLIDVISYDKFYLQVRNLSLSLATIDENKEINTTIGTLSSSGMVPALSYSLSCSTPGVDDANFFILEDTLKSSVSFDYESKSSYAICVRVTGSDAKVFDKNLTITVKNTNDAPTSQDLNITMDEDTSITFELNDFNFTDVDKGANLHSIFITRLPTAGSLKFSGEDVILNQEILDVNITNLTFTPVANAFGIPYDSFGFKVNDGEANSTNEYNATINVNNVAEPTIPTPESTPTIPESDTGQLVDSTADELETGVELGEAVESEESIILSFTDEDGTPSQVVIPKLEDTTINTVYSDEAIEFTVDGENGEQAVASYNNNGTTEHVVSVDNKETVAIFYLPGAKVEFTQEGGVQTSLSLDTQDGQKLEVIIVATAEGFSQNSITNANGVNTKADSNILGTQTVVQEDGKVVVDTPTVETEAGNLITTKTTLDANGNAVVSAVRTLPDGTKEEVALGGYPEGSQVNIQEKDGAVIVEVITTLGTQSFTLRSGRR